MGLRPFKALPVPEVVTPMLFDRVQAALEDAIGTLLRAVTNDVLVTVLVGVTDTPVTHGLGHAPRTWEIVDIAVNANVWRSPTVNARADKVILLRASAPVTVTIRFT